MKFSLSGICELSYPRNNITAADIWQKRVYLRILYANCRTFELSLYNSYQPTCVYASLIRSDHIVVLADQNGDLVGHCPFQKKKTICSSDKEENCLKCGKTPALLAIFAKVTAKDINKLSV